MKEAKLFENRSSTIEKPGAILYLTILVLSVAGATVIQTSPAVKESPWLIFAVFFAAGLIASVVFTLLTRRAK